jgi:CRISPR/Cas system CSM-associated protein Csm3 (group 7 of RAMP superfamily)
LHPVDIPLSIRFKESVHVGTGRRDGLVDRTVRRTADGHPYVPASAVKGALRQTAERLVRRLDAAAAFGDMAPDQHLGYRRRGSDVVEERCEAPRPEDMCQSASPCLVCRLFGNVYTGRRLVVDDATAAVSPATKSREALFATARNGDDLEADGRVIRQPGAAKAAETESITRLRMDRRRRGAASGALFTVEHARTHGTFKTHLTGRVPLTPLQNSDAEGEPAELVLLAATLRATDQIGGDASIGRGACRLVVRSAEAGAESDEGGAALHVGGEQYSVDRLLRPDVLEALGWGRVEGEL